MIDHVSVAVSNLEAATSFYDAVLAPIGLTQLVSRDRSSGFGKAHPEFWINARPHMAPVSLNSGAHICLRCPTKEAVIAFHKAALTHGGADAGSPQNQDGAKAKYFAAFIYDFDGNRIEAATFQRKVAT